MSTPAQAPPDLWVGDYLLQYRLGEGGMGVVHLAQRESDDGTRHRVALKVLRRHIVGDDEARARLAREVNALARVRSTRVSEIVDADPWGPIPFVATRYVPGLSLDAYVADEGAISGADLQWFASCLAEAVAAVHAAGVLHRDIKPSNVLMEGRSPVLIDFGLARVANDAKLTHAGWLLGTPGYLAPEILLGADATPASDLHSLAATVAFAATGRPPFGSGPSVAVMDRVRRGEHDLSDLTDAWRELLAACLHPDPAARPTLTQFRDTVAGLGRATRAHTPRSVGSEPGLTVPLSVMPAAPLASSPAPPQVRAMGAGVHPVRATTPITVPPQPHTVHPVATIVAPSSPARRSAGQRMAAGAVLLGLAGAVAGAVAAAPWLALSGVLAVCWVLRAGSLANSARHDRVRARGPRWHDGPRLVVALPWCGLVAIGPVLLLGLWASGIAAAVGLIAVTAKASIPLALTAMGAALAFGLWWGPASSRLRRPVQSVVIPVSSRPLLAGVLGVVLLAVGCALSAWSHSQGVQWTPWTQPPWEGLARVLDVVRI